MAQSRKKAYYPDMQNHNPKKQMIRSQMIAASGIIITASLLAFAGWLGTGNQMMMSLIQSGLAWCF